MYHFLFWVKNACRHGDCDKVSCLCTLHEGDEPWQVDLETWLNAWNAVVMRTELVTSSWVQLPRVLNVCSSLGITKCSMPSRIRCQDAERMHFYLCGRFSSPSLITYFLRFNFIWQIIFGDVYWHNMMIWHMHILCND